MAKQGEVELKLTLIGNAAKQMNKVSSAASKMSTSMSSAGKKMTRNLTLPLVAVGVAGIKMAADLDTAMRDIQAISGRTDAELSKLSKTMVDMSTNAELGAFSAEKFARSMFDIESAGFKGADALEILEQASRSATAGQGDLTSSVNTTLSVLKAYNLQASETARIQDLMFTGVRLGKQTFEQLSTGVRNTAAVFSSFDIPVQDAVAAMTLFANKGVDVQRAATRMNAIILEMNKPTDELAALIDEAGFASGRQMFATLGSTRALEALNRVSIEQGVILSDTFQGRQAALGIMTLTGKNMQELISIQGELGNSTGEMGRAFDEQAKSFQFQFKKMMASIQQVLIIIGQQLIPIITPVIAKIKKWAEAFSNLDGGTQKIIVALGLMVAVGGPLLVMFASLIGAVGTVAGLFATVASALGLTTVAAAATTPAVAAVGVSSAGASTGIAALAASLWAALAPFAAVLAPIALVGAALAGLVAFGPKILQFGRDVIDGLVRGIKDPIGAVAWGIGKVFGAKMKQGTAEGVKGTSEIVVHQAWQAMNAVRKATSTMNSDLNTVAKTAVRTANIVDAASGGGGRGRQATGLFNQMGQRVVRGSGRRVSSFTGRTRDQARATFDSFGGGFGGGTTSGVGGGMAGGSLLDRLQAAISGPDAQAGAREQILSALGVAGTGAGVVNLTIEQLITQGTSEEQADEILDIITRKIQQRGGLSGRGVVF